MKTPFLPLLVSMAIAGVAWADTAPTQAGKDNLVASRDFKSLDMNKDGAISREEAASNPALTRDFDKYDEDHDGRLVMGEFAHYQGSVTTNLKGTDTPLENKAKGATIPPPPDERGHQP